MTLENEKDSNRELMELLFKKSGLNFLDLMNSIYLTNKKDPIPANLSLEEKVNIALDNLGIKGKSIFDLDTYYGMLAIYAWHNIPAERGTGFSPIYYQINKLKVIYSKDQIKLETIKRRLVYCEFLAYEMEYILKKYDFEKIRILEDWITNKLERYTTLMLELCLSTIEYFYDKKQLNNAGKKFCFENMVYFLQEIDKLFHYLNSTVDGFIITTIRNKTVHSIEKVMEKRDDTFYVFLKDVKINPKFGTMEEYKKDVFNLFYNGKKIPRKGIVVNDQKFPYITLHYKITKKGTVDWPKTRFNVDISLEGYLKIAEQFIFEISKTLFEKLIDETYIETHS